MALTTVSNAQHAFGHVPLLDHTALSLESAERVALIGRNGSGKSSRPMPVATCDRAETANRAKSQRSICSARNTPSGCFRRAPAPMPQGHH